MRLVVGGLVALLGESSAYAEELSYKFECITPKSVFTKYRCTADGDQNEKNDLEPIDMTEGKYVKVLLKKAVRTKPPHDHEASQCLTISIYEAIHANPDDDDPLLNSEKVCLGGGPVMLWTNPTETKRKVYFKAKGAMSEDWTFEGDLSFGPF